MLVDATCTAVKVSDTRKTIPVTALALKLQRNAMFTDAAILFTEMPGYNINIIV